MGLLEGLVDSKTLAVLRVFSESRDGLFHIKKVSEESGVPLSTAFRIINSLAKQDLLEIKRISNLKLYRLAQTKKARQVVRLL